jgi:branched-chain amino acid transport system permease protein
VTKSRTFWRQLTAFGVLAAIAPWVVTSSYQFHLVTLSAIWAILAVSLNLVMGYAGLLSIAHGALAIIGGYASSLLVIDAGLNFWLALIVGALFAASTGLVLGLLTLRLHGHYFAISTLAFGIVVSIVLDKWTAVTRGPVGVTGIPAPSGLGPLDFTTNRRKYFLIVVALGLTIILVRNLVNAPFGRALKLIRGNELVARSLGVNVVRHKLVAFTVSAAIAGVAGTLYATYINYLHPSDAGLWTSFFILLYVVLGGTGTLWGPVLGTLFVVVIPEQLRWFEEYRQLIFGALLIMTIMFLPGGLMELGARLNRGLALPRFSTRLRRAVARFKWSST